MQGRGSLTAALETAAVEVKVVLMRGVEIRAERHAEVPARPIVDRMQKGCRRRLAFPLVLDRDALSIGKRETADIDGVGPSVLTAKT